MNTVRIHIFSLRPNDCFPNVLTHWLVSPHNTHSRANVEFIELNLSQKVHNFELTLCFLNEASDVTYVIKPDIYPS